eukprot:Hpha_TRINITY_DN15471_c5_g15::TRINITY_DN15471_c5_g15_i1::g.176772::m.176772
MLCRAFVIAVLAVGSRAGLPDPVGPLEPPAAFDGLNSALQGVNIVIPNETVKVGPLGNVTLNNFVCSNLSLSDLSIPAARDSSGGAEFAVVLSRLHVTCNGVVVEGKKPLDINLDLTLNATLEADVVPAVNHTVPSQIVWRKCSTLLPAVNLSCTPHTAQCRLIEGLLPYLSPIVNLTACKYLESESSPTSKVGEYVELAAALLESWEVTRNPIVSPEDAEAYLAPWKSQIAGFSKNNKIVRIGKLIDFFPAKVIDWILSLFLKHGTYTVKLEKPIHIPLPLSMGNLTLMIESLEITGLNKFTTIKPLQLGGDYTWKTAFAMKEAGLILSVSVQFDEAAAEAVRGKKYPMQLSIPLTDISLDMSTIIAFNVTRMCDLVPDILSSYQCTLWSLVHTKSTTGKSVSGLNITNLEVSVGGWSVAVTGLGQGLDDAIKGAMTELELVFGGGLRRALPLGLSYTMRGILDRVIYDELLKIDAEDACPAGQDAPALGVSRVCVMNEAAFVMNFGVHSCDSGATSPSSGDYAFDKHRCIEVSSIPNVTEGQILRLATDAVLGKRELAAPALRYEKDSNVATFTCRGTTFDYRCKLQSYTPVSPGKLAEVGQICVTNGAAFVMHWAAVDPKTGDTSASSGNYAIDQTRCIDLGSIPGVQQGDQVQAHVKAVLGRSKVASTPVVYKKNGLGATFVCKGTTLFYKCEMLVQ